MSSADAQKTEVNSTTADAESSPTAAGDAATTGAGSGVGGDHHVPWDGGPAPREAAPIALRVVSDDTDNGGPLVIQTDDPALNPPRVPSDPFPTDRTPETDPPVEKPSGTSA